MTKEIEQLRPRSTGNHSGPCPRIEDRITNRLSEFAITGIHPKFEDDSSGFLSESNPFEIVVRDFEEWFSLTVEGVDPSFLKLDVRKEPLAGEKLVSPNPSTSGFERETD